MNREIKFRAWDKSDGRMLSVFEPEEQGKREYYPFVVAIGFSHWNKEDIILMQWTGLKDKKGTDIYEGDVVRLSDPYRESFKECEIRFINGGFIVEANGWFSGGESDMTTVGWAIEEDIEIEVIGNIYEPKQ